MDWRIGYYCRAKIEIDLGEYIGWLGVENARYLVTETEWIRFGNVLTTIRPEFSDSV